MKTNYEVIREMSVEEMAGLLARQKWCYEGSSFCCGTPPCCDCVRAWLNAPVEERNADK